MKERERHTELYLSLTSSCPECLQQPVLGQVRSGARNHSPVSHVGSRNRNAWTVFCCLPRCIYKQLDWKSSWGLNQHFRLVLGYPHLNWKLNPHCLPTADPRATFNDQFVKSQLFQLLLYLTSYFLLQLFLHLVSGTVLLSLIPFN